MKDDPRPRLQGHSPSGQAAVSGQRSPARYMRTLQDSCHKGHRNSRASLCAPLHLVLTAAVTFTVPPGSFITHAHLHLRLRVAPGNAADLTEVAFARLEPGFSNPGIGVACETGCASKKAGRRHESTTSQALTRAARANLPRHFTSTSGSTCYQGSGTTYPLPPQDKSSAHQCNIASLISMLIMAHPQSL